MARQEQQVETKINIKPNCKDVILEFDEHGPDGFNLSMLLRPEDATSIAHQLLTAVRALEEAHG